MQSFDDEVEAPDQEVDRKIMSPELRGKTFFFFSSEYRSLPGEQRTGQVPSAGRLQRRNVHSEETTKPDLEACDELRILYLKHHSGYFLYLDEEC